MILEIDCVVEHYKLNFEKNILDKCFTLYSEIYACSLYSEESCNNKSEKSYWNYCSSYDTHISALTKCKEVIAIQVEHNLSAKVLSENDCRWIVSPNDDWSISFRREEKNIIIYAEQEKQLLLLINTVIRQLNRSAHINSNTLFLHSASISNKNNAYVFSGNKGSGKTTLTMMLLKYLNCDSISNDVTLLRPNMLTLPVYSGAMVSYNTLKLLKFHDNEISQLKFEEKADKYYLSFYQYLTLSKASLSREARLKTIYITILNTSIHGIEVRDIPKETAFQILLPQLILEDKNHSDFLGMNPKYSKEPHELLKDILGQTRCVQLVIGSNITTKDLKTIIEE